MGEEEEKGRQETDRRHWITEQPPAAPLELPPKRVCKEEEASAASHHSTEPDDAFGTDQDDNEYTELALQISELDFDDEDKLVFNEPYNDPEV